MFETIKIRIAKYLKHTKLWRSAVLAVLLIIILFNLFYFAQAAEMMFYDLMIKVYTQTTANTKSKADNRIIMVFIDDESIEKVNRWPWPRKKYIEMFDYLQNSAGAKVIAFDSVIKGQDACTPESDEYFFSKLKDFPRVRVGLDFIRTRTKGSIASESATLLEKFALKNVTDYRTNKNLLGNYKLNGIPNPDLVANSAGMGSVLTDPYNDEEKIIRTVPHILYSNGKYYPSLSFVTVLAYFNQLNPKINIYKNKIIVNLKDKKLTIPVDQKIETPANKRSESFLINIFKNATQFFNTGNLYYYRTWIKWYSPQPGKTYSHKSVSAYKIFDAIEDIKANKTPDLDPSIFKDKIVVIGATATAITATGIEDIKSTPLLPFQPGVDIQATCINNLLNSDFMTKAPARVNWLVIALITVIIVLIIMFSQDILVSSFTLLMVAAVYFMIVMYFLYPNNIIVDTITPLTYLVVMPMIIFTYKYFIERLKRDQIQSVFSKFVSKDIMGEVLKDPDKVKIGGDRAEITVLFSDIRGFTTLSEKLSPEKISALLNEYFEAMEPIIKKHNGTLNNYIGDAIMAIFGAPIKYEDHALTAVRAAIDMQLSLDELNAKWKRQGKYGLDKNSTGLAIGIGVNTGYTYLGYVGSENLMHYTAIGDAVNIASRLEQLNKLFNTRIIISEYTYEKVRNNVEVRALKKESIRGRTEPVMVYELKGVRDLKDIIIQDL